MLGDKTTKLRNSSLLTLAFAVFFLCATLTNTAKAQDITSGLVGYWPLDDGSGLDVTDTTGGNDGVLVNSPVWVDGRIGDALQFSGSFATDNRVDISHSTALEPDDLTVSLWVYRMDDDQQEWTELLIKGQWFSGNSSIYSYGFEQVSNTNIFKWDVSHSDGEDPVMSNVVPDRTWTHLVGTYNSATKYVSIYQDGVLIDTQYRSGTRVKTSYPIVLGCYGAGQCTTQNSGHFQGKLDEIRIYDRALSAEDITLLYSSFPHALPACDGPHEAVMLYNAAKKVMQYCNGTEWISVGDASPHAPTNGLVGYWKFDEESGTTANDSSGQGHHASGQNIVNTDWVAGKKGGAVELDGVNKRFYYADADDDLLFENASFTAAVWFKSKSDAGWRLFGKTDFVSPWIVGVGSQLDGVAGLYTRTQTDDWSANFGFNVNDNQWHHLAWVFNISDNLIYYFIDGNAVGTSPLNGGTWGPNQPFYIGFANVGAPNYTNGFLDELRIYDRALDDQEILNIYYESTFVEACTSPEAESGTMFYNRSEGIMQYCNGTRWISMGPKLTEGAAGGDTDLSPPAPSAGLVGHWPLDGNANDVVGTNNGTMTGGAYSAQAKRGSNAAILDGNNDYITTTASAILDPPEFTSCAWIIRTGAGSANPWQELLGNASFQQYGWHLNFEPENTHATFYVNQPGARQSVTVNVGSTNVWRHYCASYDSGTLSLYVDGALRNTATVTAPADSSYAFRIGAAGASATTNGLQGSIDDVRIYDHALGEDEVAALYKSSSLAGHWKLDETDGTTAADSSSNNITGTLNGTDFAASNETGIVSNATIFDGSDDFITAPSNPALRILGDITISFWLKRNGTDSVETILDYAAIGEQEERNHLYQVWIQNTGRLFFEWEHSGGANISVSTTNPAAAPVGEWAYYNFVRDTSSGTVNFYVNGVLVDSDTFATLPTGGEDSTLWIAREANTNFYGINGTLDDLRIYNRALSSKEIASLYIDKGGKSLAADCSGLGDDQYHDASTGHCYYWNETTPLNWSNAKASCETNDAYLASITSQDEQDMLKDRWIVPNTSITWIGGTDTDAEGTWVWTGGAEAGQQFWMGDTSGSAVNNRYESWGTVNPNNDSNEDCLEMRGWGTHNGDWNDESCTNLRSFICEKSANIGGTCSTPYGEAGNMFYNDDENLMQYCNGSEWVAVTATAP